MKEESLQTPDRKSYPSCWVLGLEQSQIPHSSICPVTIFPGHYIPTTFSLKGGSPKGDNPNSVFFWRNRQPKGIHDGSHIAKQTLGSQSCNSKLGQQDRTTRIQVTLIISHKLEVLCQGLEGSLGLAQALPIIQSMPDLERNCSRRQAAELELRS